jgi:hypothetical protein
MTASPTRYVTMTPSPTRYVTVTPSPTLRVTNTPTVDPGPQLIAPTGTVADGYGAITYTWEPVENATGYQLYVAPADGGPGLPIHVQVGAEVCDASICTLDPSSIDPNNLLLYNGVYEVYLNAGGAWGGPFTFTLELPQAQPVTALSVSGLDSTLPTFSWTIGAGDASSHYQVYIAPENDLFVPAVSGWFSRAEVCDGTQCSLTAPEPMLSGSYMLYVQSYGPGGMSAWAGPLAFALTNPETPATPANVSASANAGLVTVTWDADPNSDWVQVYILGDNGSTYWDWHAAEDICDATTCTLAPPMLFENGSYDVYLQAYGNGQFSVGGELGGWAGPVTFSVNFSAPNPVTDLALSSASPPSFTWQGQTGAGWYEIWVGAADLSDSIYYGWQSTLDLGCLNAETCTFTPDAAMGAGSYVIYVRPFGPAGYGQNAEDGWVHTEFTLP